MVDSFTGDTEFSTVDVDVDPGHPGDQHQDPEAPTVYVNVTVRSHPDDQQTLALTFDEARHVIAGLAAVIR